MKIKRGKSGGVKRARNVHQHRNGGGEWALAKYIAKMTLDDCGHRVPVRGGIY